MTDNMCLYRMGMCLIICTYIGWVCVCHVGLDCAMTVPWAESRPFGIPNVMKALVHT